MQTARLTAYIPLRDTYETLYTYEADNHEFIKADIFDHPVSFNINEVTQVDTPEEALSASLNKFGGVNLGYMAWLTSMDVKELIDGLKGRIYFNPLISGYEVKDRFVAGNVIDKAERIENWIEMQRQRREEEGEEYTIDPSVAESLQALKDAYPERIQFADLDFNFGERWIPTGIFSAYMTQLYGTDIRIGYSESMDEFSVNCSEKNMKITEEFCVRGYYRTYDGINLLKHALHNTCPDMMKSIWKENKRRVKHIGSKSFGIQFLLKGIYTHNGLLYFHTEIKNTSNVPFDVDYITWKIVDKKVAKRTAIQEQVIQPLRTQNFVLNVGGNTSERTVWTMDKFTMPDDKCLVVELAEKNGGRHQSFVIENTDLVRARVISELKVSNQ